MTATNRNNYLVGNRKWYMKIEGLFRDAVEREASLTGEALKQEFCIILTIRDPDEKAPVYNEVTQQLQQRGFAYSDVRLKNEVKGRVHIENDDIG